MSDALGALIAVVVLFIFLTFPISYVQKYECQQKWKDSGLSYKYTFFGGCKIQTKPNVWVPAENYREI